MVAGHDRSRPITDEMMAQAKERLIERRETHIDQLVDKLHEERVRRIIEPILAGTSRPDLIPGDLRSRARQAMGRKDLPKS